MLKVKRRPASQTNKCSTVALAKAADCWTVGFLRSALLACLVSANSRDLTHVKLSMT